MWAPTYQNRPGCFTGLAVPKNWLAIYDNSNKFTSLVLICQKKRLESNSVSLNISGIAGWSKPLGGDFGVPHELPSWCLERPAGSQATSLKKDAGRPSILTTFWLATVQGELQKRPFMQYFTLVKFFKLAFLWLGQLLNSVGKVKGAFITWF